MLNPVLTGCWKVPWALLSREMVGVGSGEEVNFEAELPTPLQCWH